MASWSSSIIRGGAIAYSAIAPYGVEGIFLGVNCVLYGFCAYTLWGQKPLPCRILLIINTLQFLLCLVQILLHAIFIFLVLTVNPLRYLEKVNGCVLAATIIYNVNFIVGGFLSMWRLYVLYDNNLKVCIPAFIFWIGQLCTGGITIFVCATVPIISERFDVAHLALWAFIAALNLCVAIPICYRLCMAQKRTHSVLSPSLFKSIAIVLVECGALITLCTVGMLIIYLADFRTALRCLGIATEVAVASQLLITARYAMLSRDDDGSSPPPTELEIHVGPKPRPIIVPLSSEKSNNLSKTFVRAVG